MLTQAGETPCRLSVIPSNSVVSNRLLNRFSAPLIGADLGADPSGHGVAGSITQMQAITS